MKFCKDCRFYRAAWCVHPDNHRNLVSGWPASCELTRIERCGKDAQWFEPKPPSKVRRWLGSIFGGTSYTDCIGADGCKATVETKQP